MRIQLIVTILIISAGQVFAGEDVISKQTPYDKADGFNGGLLYDKFWQKGEVAAQFSNKFGLKIDRINKYSEFYRCKSCHGWDQIGSNGYYIKKSPEKAKQPNVSTVNLKKSAISMTPEEIFAKIKNPSKSRPISYDPAEYDPATDTEMGDRMPNYRYVFTDSEIWDLVKFLKEDALDHKNYYTLVTEGSYPNGKSWLINIGKGGDSNIGDRIYAETCSSCHGANGREINIKGLSVGEFTRKKAYELAHKIKFGHPGSNMFGTNLSVQEMKDIHKALADESKYLAIEER